jgi:hypothetical protein
VGKHGINPVVVRTYTALPRLSVGSYLIAS